MLTTSLGRTMKFVAPRSIKFAVPSRMMATAIDPRTLSPDPPKPGKPRVKGWDRATFTIKVCNAMRIVLIVEWTCVPWYLIRRKPQRQW